MGVGPNVGMLLFVPVHECVRLFVCRCVDEWALRCVHLYRCVSPVLLCATKNEGRRITVTDPGSWS